MISKKKLGSTSNITYTIKPPPLQLRPVILLNLDRLFIKPVKAMQVDGVGFLHHPVRASTSQSYNCRHTFSNEGVG